MTNIRLFTFAASNSLLQMARAEILNGTVKDLLCPQMRSSMANYLIEQNILPAEQAYLEVFNKIPESGNCWCNNDKSLAAKGPTHDQYDEACKTYHECITCGYSTSRMSGSRMPWSSEFHIILERILSLRYLRLWWRRTASRKMMTFFHFSYIFTVFLLRWYSYLWVWPRPML